ncbi:hypothetical protein OIY81_3476 [Cryptosporidium canis]|nr:hypothetical protein OIY81_3476 [Cryptosporidium canis]
MTYPASTPPRLGLSGLSKQLNSDGGPLNRRYLDDPGSNHAEQAPAQLLSVHGAVVKGPNDSPAVDHLREIVVQARVNGQDGHLSCPVDSKQRKSIQDGY